MSRQNWHSIQMTTKTLYKIRWQIKKRYRKCIISQSSDNENIEQNVCKSNI